LFIAVRFQRSTQFVDDAAPAGDNTDLATFIEAAAVHTTPVGRFFDDILVMSDDPQERATRLGLLAEVRDLGVAVLDWSALSV
jgi:glycyl-tRNA synthetase